MQTSDEPSRTHAATRSLRIGDTAPLFRARSTRGVVDLESRRGRWVLFFSHPADFTPVCTSEFVVFARLMPQFDEIGCDLLGLSVDSLYAHLAWVRAIKDLFGVEIGFPIVEDPSMAVGRAYGMLDESAQDSSAVRSTYVIDPDGVIRAITWYPANVGRSVRELLRLVRALQRAAAGDAMTPEGWEPGADVLAPPEEALVADGRQLAPDWFHNLRKDG